MRAGTGNVSGVAGMCAAADYTAGHLEDFMQYETALRNYTVRRITKEIPLCRLNGHENNRLPGNLNFSFAYADGGALLAMLDMRGICVSTGSACASHSSGPSHVLKAIGLSDELAYSSVRITLSAENTREEMDAAIDALKECVAELRQKSEVYQKAKGINSRN
jgi:cysteine desulfurase